MIFQYGSYQHPDGEVSAINVSAKPRRSPRGIRHSTIYEMHIGGELCFSGEVTQSDISSRVQALEAAYKEDYKDAKLLHSDGTDTPIIFQNSNSNNITGNMITYRSWPGNLPEDYATTKEFRVGIRAEFLETYTNLYDYQQSISIQGTGGPINRWDRLADGTWTLTNLYPTSTKKIVQYGRAVGYTAYPFPPAPILGLTYEHQELREIDRIGPKSYYRGPRLHEIRWKYVFETPFVYTPVVSYPAMPL